MQKLFCDGIQFWKSSSLLNGELMAANGMHKTAPASGEVGAVRFHGRPVNP
jgi:hypothetical protein